MAEKPWEKSWSQQQPSGPWDKFAPSQPEAESGFLQRTADWVTGSRREESIPLASDANLQLPAGKAAKMTALLATTASDDRLRSGISEIIPDAQFETDQYGNLVVIAPVGGEATDRSQWTRFYPNPQGLDKTDVMQGLGIAALASPMGRAAEAIGLGGGLLAGGVIGGAEAALIEKASSELSNAPFKFSDIPYGVAGGMGGAWLGNQIGKLLASKGVSQVFDAAGALTPQAKAVLQRAGVEEGAITADVAQAVSDYVSKGVDPAQAGRSAMAETLPVPVPLSRGQVSNTPVQQIFESEAGKGVYGEAPMRLMQDLQRRQQEALRANIPAFQTMLGGDIIERGAGGAAAQAALAAQRSGARQEASRLYDVAEAAGYSYVPKEIAGEVDDNLAASIRGFNPMATPVTRSIYDEINQVLASGGDVTSLFRLRTQLVNAGNAGSVEQVAANALKETLDKELARLADQALLSGDNTAISAWNKAISNYADFAGTWKSRGILDQLTQTVRQDGSKMLKVSPEQAANYILGASGSGMITKPNLVRNLQTLKSQLPENEWNGLRQEAFLRIFDSASRGQDVSGQTFSTLWNRFQRENPALTRELFSEGERAMFSQFAAVATRVSSSAKNTSNSATTLMGIIPKIAQAFNQSSVGRLVSALPLAPFVKERLGALRIGGALQGAPTPMTAPAGTAGAAVGGIFGGSGVVNDPAANLIDEYTGIKLP